MGLLLLVITSLSVMILVTTKGVCGQQWGVTYQPERICAFVGDSVDLSCSYTYPSVLTLKETYWTKENYWDYRDLFSDRDYNSRIHVDCSRVGKCQLRINSLTTSDTGPYNCRITTHTEGEKWIGKPGAQLYVREAQDPPQTTSVSICPPDNNIVEGTHVTLTCISRPDLHVPVLSYSWYKSGHHLTQGTENTYIIHSFTYTQSGDYYCYVSYSNGAREGSSIVNLQVYYGPRTPVVVIEPHGQIAEGSRVTLTCSTDANPPPQTYSWYKGTMAMSNRNKVLTFTVRAEHSGKYTCQVTNTYGHSRSHYKELHVTYGPRIPVIVIDPPGQIVAGCLVNLTCSTDANPPPHTYSWYKREGTIQVNYREKVLTFSNVRSEDSGNYSCQATNTYGSNTSPNTEIHVLYGARTPVIIIDPPGNIAEGSRVTLTCSSDANTPVESYTWFKVNESTPVGSGQQYSITNIRPEDGGQYYCEAKNILGSQVSTAVSITVEGISASGEQSLLVTAVVVVSVCGVVGLLCVLVWLRQMKRRQEPGGQDQHYFSVTGQSRAAEDAGGAEDAGHYSTVQPHGSRQTSGGAEDAGHYSTVQPHGSRQTAGAQEDDVQYSSVQFKKAGAAKGSPVQPEGEPSPIYSSVQPRVDNSVVYSGVQPRGI